MSTTPSSRGRFWIGSSWVEHALSEIGIAIEAACAPWADQLQLLQTIPGVGPKVAQVLIAETGGGHGHVPDARPTSRRGPGWRRQTTSQPVNEPRAGRRRGNKWLSAMLVEAAGSVARMHNKNYLAVQHARLTRRRWMSRAQIAVAHSILTTAHYMLKRDEPYHDLGPEWLAKRTEEAHTRRLVAQLEKFGHTVVIDPVA